MKKKEDRRSKLEILQDIRTEAEGLEHQHLKAQRNIDDYFFKNPSKQGKKKRKKKRVSNPDDLWW